MIECARCGRLYPEVLGAREQICPHCGLESAAGARAAEEDVAVDPVGAAALAMRFLRARYGALLLLATPVLAVHLAGVFAVQAYVLANGLDAPVLTSGQQMQFLGVWLPLILLVGAAWFAYWPIPAALMLDGSARGPRVRAAAKRWPQLALVGFVLTLLYAVGLLLLVVPFLVFAHWYLHVPAALAEGCASIFDAFESSRQFARSRRTHGFTALVLMVWTATGALVFALDSLLAPRLGALAPAVWPLATWLTLPLLPTFPAAFWTLAGRDAAAPASAPHVTDETQRAPASAPKSATTCPGCGALIRYQTVGSPVDVVCPSCGRSGRVL